MCCLLWIGFKFVSLTYQKQFLREKIIPSVRCELVSNLYLWRIRNNCIVLFLCSYMLWIGFKFVSLTYQKQYLHSVEHSRKCCELVSNLYLWRIRNNGKFCYKMNASVVNWFQICIFDVSETILPFDLFSSSALWIGFKFVSLTYQKQYTSRKRRGSFVVNWFQICIFDVSETI